MHRSKAKIRQGRQETSMAELRHDGQTKEQELNRQWKQGQESWEEYRDTALL